ncbi:cation diffusion facilitator family transporter [Luminiphilus sp.]|nr:cation diffusion facilitator family transporter [Luminiphilus sp.]
MRLTLGLGTSAANRELPRGALAPPDSEHRFGHGKAESIAGLAQAMFIAGSGVFLIIESIERWVQPRPINELSVGLAVMAFAMVATLILLIIQTYLIRRTNSVAIKADSLHYKTDLLTNAAIIVALLLSQQGWYAMDPLFAFGVAIYILYSAGQIAKEAFNDFLDRELPD